MVDDSGIDFILEPSSFSQIVHIKLPQTTHSKEAVDWFLTLNPDELLSQIVFRYEDYMTDQQKELERIRNDRLSN